MYCQPLNRICALSRGALASVTANSRAKPAAAILIGPLPHPPSGCDGVRAVNTAQDSGVQFLQGDFYCIYIE